MDIFERAYRVGRLDELVEKGENFDWSGVPEFTSKYSNIWKNKSNKIKLTLIIFIIIISILIIYILN